jgi:mono/diheme cytochrome c family protein
MKVLKVLVALLLFAAVGTVAFVIYAWHGALDRIDPPDPRSFTSEEIRRGADLAAIGNCNVCHTAPGGRIFAGGLGLLTPFGTIYSTNITPDPETGIGRWSEAAFRRAMRQGVDRAGRHLYPAFPYDHFTLVSDEDDRALYAFLMTREPVSARAPKNALPFPLNIRLAIAGWKLLFFKQGPYRPQTGQNEAWNRGAYLVEGLGHCGGCHTPRNFLGAEKKRQRFAGGEAEGWTAYALDASSPAPVAWDGEALFAYLRRGWHEAHGAARGPMAPVVSNLGAVAESDVRAIAGYIAAVMGEPSPQRQRQSKALLARVEKGQGSVTSGTADSQATTGSTAPVSAGDNGARIYASACASCHESGRPLPFGGIDLSLSTGPSGPTPTNVLNVVLFGLPAQEGERSPIMPAFGGMLDDRQLASLLAFVRARFSDKGEWSGIEKHVRDARSGGRDIAIRPMPGSERAPAGNKQRVAPW